MSGHVAEEPDFGESGGGGWKGGHLRFDLDEGVVWKGKMNVNCSAYRPTFFDTSVSMYFSRC